MKMAGWMGALAGLLSIVATASPTAALRIRKAWEIQSAEWNLRMQGAATDEEKARVREDAPDARASVAEMWHLIGRELSKEWTIEPAAWILSTGSAVRNVSGEGVVSRAFDAQIRLIRQAVETHHLKSPSLLPMCVALAANPDPHSLSILEKVAVEHPDPSIQGVAALGAALLLGQLGDDPGILQKRLTHLRKAIIQSSQVDFGGQPVAEIAKSELYVINHLTKGMQAPDITGMDAAGRSLRLSDFSGKVVYLLFWNSRMSERERVLQMAAEARKRFEGKPFELVGVHVDSLEVLRGLEADGTVPWRNFSDPTGALANQFRATVPKVFILDRERKIQFAGTPGSFADLTCEAMLE